LTRRDAQTGSTHALARSTRLADASVLERETELAALEQRLADRELLLKTLRMGLRAFEIPYLRAVRPRFAELDRVEAEIAGAMSALDPESEELREIARQARERADSSARASDEVAVEASGCHTPSVGLKRLFRRVAMHMHPDLGFDADEAPHRHELMVEANRAYRDGDLGLLETLLALFESSGDAVAERAELRRVLWSIARAERRLADVDREIAEVEASELFDLWRRAEVAAEQGCNLVQEKAGEIDRKLAKAQARLEVLLAVV
jgi:hypothetical protein